MDSEPAISQRLPPGSAGIPHLDPDLIESAVHVAANAMFLADRSGRISWVNQAFARLYGYAPCDVLGQTPRVLKSGRQTQAFYRDLWTTIRDGRVWRGHLCNRHRDGQLLDVDQTITPVCNDKGEVTHYFVVYEDITERLRSERQLTQLAMFDSLTGLANRNQFHARLNEATARSRRSGKPVAVMMIDLDHFKNVNDTLGHAGGDELLGQVGRCLSSAMRETDLVARLSGDEFAVLVEGISLPDQAIDSAQRILDILAHPFRTLGTSIQIGASIGIAISGNGDGIDSAEELMRHADLAMYQAKSRGRMRFQFYDASMDQNARRRHETRMALREALRGDAFTLAFQPQVDLRNGKLVGAEALLRWNDPRRGSVTAGDFIGIAEQDGTIVALNDWVLRTAIEKIGAFHRDFGTVPPIAVNVSASQFDRVDLATTIENLLSLHGVEGKSLHLEVTETVMLRSSLTVHDNLRTLERLGVKLNIDDFGTGYSSLPALREFPVNAIKLDMGYVRGIGRSTRDEKLLAGMIGLAQKLGLDVIAEGVETPFQRDFLINAGCTVAQGHLFQPALPEEAFRSQLQLQRAAVNDARSGLGRVTSDRDLMAG